MSTVYVVSYAPADDQGGVGGFDWHADRVPAEEFYVEAVRESARDVREGNPGHVVRLVMVDVPPTDGDDRAAGITEWIEYMAQDGVETYYPARRQYVPPTTIPEHIPTGGADRRTFPEE